MKRMRGGYFVGDGVVCFPIVVVEESKFDEGIGR